MKDQKSVAVPLRPETLTLYEMRKQSGVSGARATEYANISYRALLNWESGKNVPNLIGIIRLLEIYGYSFDQLDVSPFQSADEKSENHI